MNVFTRIPFPCLPDRNCWTFKSIEELFSFSYITRGWPLKFCWHYRSRSLTFSNKITFTKIRQTSLSLTVISFIYIFLLYIQIRCLEKKINSFYNISYTQGIWSNYRFKNILQPRILNNIYNYWGCFSFTSNLSELLNSRFCRRFAPRVCLWDKRYLLFFSTPQTTYMWSIYCITIR